MQCTSRIVDDQHHLLFECASTRQAREQYNQLCTLPQSQHRLKGLFDTHGQNPRLVDFVNTCMQVADDAHAEQVSATQAETRAEHQRATQLRRVAKRGLVPYDAPLPHARELPGGVDTDEDDVPP